MSGDALQFREENPAGDRPLAAMTREALSRLDRLALCGEGRDRLLHLVTADHPEARGCRAAEERVADDLFVQKKTFVRQSIGAFVAAASKPISTQRKRSGLPVFPNYLAAKPRATLLMRPQKKCEKLKASGLKWP